MKFPWVFLGRKTKPLALAALAVALSPLYEGPGMTFDFSSTPGLVQAAAAALAVLALVVGWFARSVKAVRMGLLLVAGVFTARAALTGLSVGVTHPALWINFAWVVAAGGAYVLEHDGDGDGYE